MTEKHYLQCDCCYNLYGKIINIVTNQASDCASDFYLKNGLTFISSYYGSDYDDLHFKTTGWKPPKECGVICDKCIEQLIDKELITEISISDQI